MRIPVAVLLLAASLTGCEAEDKGAPTTVTLGVYEHR